MLKFLQRNHYQILCLTFPDAVPPATPIKKGFFVSERSIDIVPLQIFKLFILITSGSFDISIFFGLAIECSGKSQQFTQKNELYHSFSFSFIDN